MQNKRQIKSFKISSLAAITALAILLSGCSSLRFPGVYRIDIAQGNLITKDMVEKLKLGMSPRQVEYVMGSAMIQDTFHPDRWDYLYRLETGNGVKVENRLALYFENNRLARIDNNQYRDPDKVKNELLLQMGVEPTEEAQKPSTEAEEDSLY